MWDNIAAVIDGADSMGPAQILHKAMHQYGMLEKAGRDYARASASKDDEAKRQFACDEAIAVAEAIHALRALGASEARRTLEEYHNVFEGKPTRFI